MDRPATHPAPREQRPPEQPTAESSQSSPAVATDLVYQCPGELTPISRSVHLARLNAFYPACQNCAHNCDTGQTSPAIVKRVRSAHDHWRNNDIITEHGIRGLNQNVIHRTLVGQLCSAFARLIARQIPLVGRFGHHEKLPLRRRPQIVLGRDDRTGTPALTAAAIRHLTLSGCDVIDIGECTRPVIEFAIVHLSAAAGIMVTGCGHGPEFAGLDFFDSHGNRLEPGVPDSTTDADANAPLSLRRLLSEKHQPPSRPTRGNGTVRTFRAGVPYVADLLRLFRRISPTTFCVAAARPIVKRQLTQLLGEKNKRGKFLRLATQDERAHLKQIRQQVSRFVINQRGAFGVLMYENGLDCDVFDEAGRLIPSATLFHALVESTTRLYPGSAIVAATDIYDSVRSAFPDQACFSAAAETQSVNDAMDQFDARLGGGFRNRYWIDSARCDSLPIVASLLEHVGELNEPISRLVATVTSRNKVTA